MLTIEDKIRLLVWGLDKWDGVVRRSRLVVSEARDLLGMVLDERKRYRSDYLDPPDE